MAERIAGQDSIATVVVNGEIVGEFPIENHAVELMTDVESHQYAGENAPRKRERYNGYSFNCSGHCEGSAQTTGFMAMVEAVEKRARNKTSGTKINIASTLLFPNGDLRRTTLLDVRLSGLKYEQQGNDIIPFSFSGEASTATRQ